jgi:hypothetical protein
MDTAGIAVQWFREGGRIAWKRSYYVPERMGVKRPDNLLWNETSHWRAIAPW